MKRILRVFLYIMIAAGCLSGCQQGVTDVGNPSVTAKPPQVSPNTTNPGSTLGQLIGAYSQPQLAAASPAPGGSPPPTAAPALPACTTDPMAAPSITSTMDPTQIVLNDFLEYGAATDHLVSAYDAKTGALSFQISDASAAIKSCTGSAKDSGNGISITLLCAARASGDPDCQVTFDKD